MSYHFRGVVRPVVSEEARMAIRIGRDIHEAVRAESVRFGMHGVLVHEEKSSHFERWNVKTGESDRNFSPELNDRIRSHRKELKVYAEWYLHQTVDEPYAVVVGRRRIVP